MEMSVDGFHLAQLNIGRMRAETDDPLVAEFMAALDEVNALADASAGFVWRLQTEDGNATAVRPFGDALILVNMSVWESVEALADYVYRSDHTRYLRRRREWFERMDEAHMVLWWVPRGYRPTVTDAVERLEHLRREGPSPFAFTFRTVFAPSGSAVPADDRDACPL
jgi:Domain of unknown function (DUF3291)